LSGAAAIDMISFLRAPPRSIIAADMSGAKLAISRRGSDRGVPEAAQQRCGLGKSRPVF